MGYSEDQLEEMYREDLDEVGKQGIENYGYLLEQGDPTAYRCGLVDYMDAYTECTRCGCYFDRDDDPELCADCIDDDDDEEEEEV
ncbi:MAG: hypothetical protein WC491_08115 [Candidatus Omnitrophota bacterium]|jgi:hypothetical protein